MWACHSIATSVSVFTNSGDTGIVRKDSDGIGLIGRSVQWLPEELIGEKHGTAPGSQDDLFFVEIVFCSEEGGCFTGTFSRDWKGKHQ